jgi:hypothetical protein
MDVVTILTENPELAAALVAVLRMGLAYQRSVTYTEFRTLHAGKRALFPTLQRVTPSGLSFVNRKGYRKNDDEYLQTADESVRAVAKRLRRAGGSYHLLSSIKRRKTLAGRQYSVAHLVWTHGDGKQTECYLFRSVEDGKTDVYAHSEASVTNPTDHLDGPQPDGDPRGVVRAGLSSGGADE